MLFKEIIPVYTENIQNPQIQNAELLIVKVAGIYSYHSALKGQAVFFTPLVTIYLLQVTTKILVFPLTHAISDSLQTPSAIS
jgi:hypothetical protein